MDDELLRLQVYRTFAWTGRAPGTVELADALDVTSSEVAAGLRRLADERHLSLDPGGAIVMAHPFTAVPMGFSVMGDHTLWWGGCAWDSYALPQLLGDVVPGSARVLVATTCPACGSPHAWNVDAAAPPEGDQMAHFLVPAAHIWDDVVHTCSHQRIFCSTGCIDDWLRRTGHPRGYVMDLATLWRLAAHWYDGRLESGYRRRDPATAADYLRSVGLAGPFWGL
jgi:Alkylmercury lyase